MSLFICSVAFAAPKPKSQSFNAPAKTVFSAAVAAGKEHYVIKTVDDENMLVTFRASPTMTVPAYQATASVEAEPDGTSKLILSVEFETFMLGDHTSGPAKKFFQYVSENMANLTGATKK